MRKIIRKLGQIIIKNWDKKIETNSVRVREKIILI